MSVRSSLLIFLVLTASVHAAEPPAPVIFSLPRELEASNDLAPLEKFATEQEAQGSFDLAAQALQRAVEIAPQNMPLKMRLAECRYRQGPGANAEAMNYAEALLDESNLDPTLRNRALLLRGLLHFEQANFPSAQADFMALVQADPTHTRAAIGLAATELALGKIVEAEARLNTMGDAAAPYAVELRYLLRVALQQFARSRVPVPPELRVSLEGLANRAGISSSRAK